MVVVANADDMLAIGLNCIGFGPERSARHNPTTRLNHYESAFGIDPFTSSVVFYELQVRDIGAKRVSKPKVTYFLLALHWLKRYPVELISSGIFGYHEDTVRKYVWIYCEAIQALMPYKVRHLNTFNYIIFILTNFNI
jgi:hypothetical protein